MASRFTHFGHRPYPGDNPIKKEARHHLYQHVMRKIPRRFGHIVTLAGPDAAEIPYLRDLIQAPAKSTWFVDVREEGLLVAKHQWPGVRTFHGPIEKVLSSDDVPCVRFAHFDFMGLYTSTVGKSVRALGPKLMRGGIVAITFIRCRENSPSNLRARHLAADVGLPGQTQGAREIQRWAGTFMALQEDLGKELVLVDGSAYHHHHSAMGAMIVQAA